MRMSAEQFLNWESKSITLLAMSGAGKTRLAKKLPQHKWFHYSGDYRIGTHYLNEVMHDNLKRQAMNVPFLRDLLLSDSIYIRNNISVNNLTAISSFLGKLGNPAQGGLSLTEFKHRQQLHRHAEIQAMLDVPHFIKKAGEIYHYQCFLNDAGGSICELESPQVLETLAQHSVLIYIKIPLDLEQTMINRAKSKPKPLYYREDFLDTHLEEFMLIKGYTHSEKIVPDEFVSWVFPYLFKSRLPRYDAIAQQYGYTLTAEEVSKVTNETDFIQLITNAMTQNPQTPCL